MLLMVPQNGSLLRFMFMTFYIGWSSTRDPTVGAYIAPSAP